MTDAAQSVTGARPRRVWDVPTRLFHWLLAISMVLSWFTATTDMVSFDLPAIGGSKPISLPPMQVHMYLGYWTGGLIIFRILWGVAGSRHARFTDFVRGPVTTVRYGLSVLGRDHHETAGHNPTGGWMVVVMLALIASQVATGLFANDDIVWAGPWSHTVSSSLEGQLTAWHHFNVNLLYIAVALHLVAIAYYALVLRKNLVGPMVTGRKAAGRVSEADAISGTPWLRFLIVALIAAGAAYAMVALAPPAPMDDLGF
jgi:cytochrome b